jgi:galactose mutarotase-like enzyme
MKNGPDLGCVGTLAHMSQPARPWISITSGTLTAEVDPLGAQLSVLRDGQGRDLLWNGDPAVWSGRAPLLFPIVGTLVGGAYRVGSSTYHLPRHGLARGRMFDVAASGAADASFRLRADESTLQSYPFRFELLVSFVLTGATLSIKTRIHNAGEVDMPASFGYHPGFRWPLPFGQARSSHFIEFETDEPAPFRRLDADGLLTPERHPTPIVKRRLQLADSLFTADVVIFDAIKSRSVTYGADQGPRIRIAFPDSPYLGLWSKPGGAFVCIEPWHGVADPGSFAGDLATKPGVFVLAPGETLPVVMELTLLD